MKYAWIDAHRDQFTLAELCAVLHVSVSGYRACKRGGTADRQGLTDTQLLVLIQSIHAELKGAYGSPRMFRELRARDLAAIELLAAPAVFRGRLAVVDQREELAWGDSMLTVAWRKQKPAVDFPAGPRNVAGEHGQQTHAAGVGLAGGAPAPIRSRGNAAERSGLFVAETAAKLKGREGGQIGREALGEKLGFRPVFARAGARFRPLVYCA